MKIAFAASLVIWNFAGLLFGAFCNYQNGSLAAFMIAWALCTSAMHGILWRAKPNV